MLQGVSYNLGGLEGKKLKDLEAYGGLESENLQERVSSDYLYRSLSGEFKDYFLSSVAKLASCCGLGFFV